MKLFYWDVDVFSFPFGQGTKFQEVFVRATQLWEKSGIVRFQEVAPGRRVDFCIYYGGEYLDEEGIVAKTTSMGTPKPSITMNMAYQWSTSLSWFGRLFASGRDALSVTCHEIGHAMGLEHNNAPSSIMQPGDLSLPSRPGKLDFKNLQAILGS